MPNQDGKAVLDRDPRQAFAVTRLLQLAVEERLKLASWIVKNDNAALLQHFVVLVEERAERLVLSIIQVGVSRLLHGSREVDHRHIGFPQGCLKLRYARLVLRLERRGAKLTRRGGRVECELSGRQR